MSTALRGLAQRRETLHEHHASSRPLSPDYELVGLAGEAAFARASGLLLDDQDRPEGDRGRDFAVSLTIDVKTARQAYNLIVEEGKVDADIYVLARYDDGTEQATLLGWEWGDHMASRPTRDFGYGVINHYLSACDLRDMGTLLRFLGHVTATEQPGGWAA